MATKMWNGLPLPKGYKGELTREIKRQAEAIPELLYKAAAQIEDERGFPTSTLYTAYKAAKKLAELSARLGKQNYLITGTEGFSFGFAPTALRLTKNMLSLKQKYVREGGHPEHPVVREIAMEFRKAAGFLRQKASEIRAV